MVIGNYLIIKNESGYTIIDWDELEMRSDVDVYFIPKKKLKRASQRLL